MDNDTVSLIIKGVVSLAAILAICYLESQAIQANINGTQLALALAAVAGIAGFSLKDFWESVKQRSN